MTAGYYRFPSIQKDTLVFACEDDLWSVPVSGGVARRLTSNLGEVTRPALSPDGAYLAFTGKEEGDSEVYIMPAQGGPAKRLTYMGGSLCQTLGWTHDQRIIFANNAAQPFSSLLYLYTVDMEGGSPQQMPFGPARAVTFGPANPNGRRPVVIGRNTGDPARWKRYRGGTAGQLWIDPLGDGEFKPLITLKGNTACPMWIGERIYFLSDHEGIGNLYSCLPSGKGLRRHTDHADFYARNASCDGQQLAANCRIVYHAGADLYLYEPARRKGYRVEVVHRSPQTQRNRKFTHPGKHLEEWALHPRGHGLAVITRGKLFALANWEGAVTQFGEPKQTPNELHIRYRLAHWLNDGERLIAVTDQGGEEKFIILSANSFKEAELIADLDIGRPVLIAVNPKKDLIAFSNHRHELFCLDLVSHALTLIDRGKADRIAGFSWSPDGEWLAYSVSISLQVAILKLWKGSSGESYALTRPVLRDVAPAFDPQGRFLYFLSFRYFDPVYDNLQFDLNFPRGVKPYLITLQKETPSPFIPVVKPLDEKKDEKVKLEKEAVVEKPGDEKAKEEEKPEEKPLQIDLEGIETRIVAFPVEEGRYGRILGTKDGKVLYSRYPVEGALSQDFHSSAEPPAKGAIFSYNFDDQKEELYTYGVTDFRLSRDGGALIYRAGNHLRVLKASEKPDNKESNGQPGRKSGWIDLERIKAAVTPAAEWRQMFREAWRLQRDQFWTPDMSNIDWLAVHDRYLPLVERVASRAEFSDLMWEMQGELGTSHCYEFGGDYRPAPDYSLGYLGADFAYDAGEDGWRITRMVSGDPWAGRADSPLNAPGINLSPGDVLLAVNGRRLSAALSPGAALVNLGGSEVMLTVSTTSKASAPPSDPESDKKQTRTVTVKTLTNETPARYREWVEANRQRVHAASQGRVGYVHIPDMGARGYAEFHRGYLAEVDREGLLVDVRFNGGGHVSALILGKLARRRIGYDHSRWSEFPAPYPPESVAGPMVALTNEHAGSDGDIFSHGFKLMKLGPLLGKRTWGGVVGIWPRQSLVDGTVTTQPEFSFWFTDVGWSVENYGTDPDIEIDNLPQDYARGYDAQLERAIAEIMKMMDSYTPRLPDLANKPDLTLPKLPERK